MARTIASVIISASNEVDQVEACFASLAAQKTRQPFEVHFVVHSSTDGTYALARRLATKQKRKNIFVWRQRKPGAPAARNLGARKARGSLLVFTSANCRLAPDWLQQITRPLLDPTHYPLAALGGDTECVSKAGRRSLWQRYQHDLFRALDVDRLSDFPSFLPWAPACNLAVRTEVFRALRGFDERWGSSAYDVDFCWRLVLCGFVLGHAPKAHVQSFHRHSLRSLMRKMEDYAYFYQSLLGVYQKALGLPSLGAEKEQMFGKGRRLLSLLQSTNSLSQASFRGFDTLLTLASFKGALEARLSRAKPDPRLAPMRRGETPPALAGHLPRGYQHLHQEGWAYWKAPSSVDENGDLVLFRPKKAERFRLNPTAWRIWEVKSERGQSEDAAEALQQNPEDEGVLRAIDELILDFRTRRLLP